MAKNTSITLGDHYDSFITDQIDSGRYASVSEIIRAGLRLLENNETKINTLRSMLSEGEKSGLADYNYEDFVAELDDPYNK